MLKDHLTVVMLELELLPPVSVIISKKLVSYKKMSI